MYPADVWSEEATVTSRQPLWVRGDSWTREKSVQGRAEGNSSWRKLALGNLCKGWSKGVWGSTWNPRNRSQKHPSVIPSSTLTAPHPLREADCTHTVWGGWVACDRLSLLTSLEEQTHVGRSGSCFGGLWPRILGCGQDWVCQGEGLNSLLLYHSGKG